jgi:hypothetical protein
VKLPFLAVLAVAGALLVPATASADITPISPLAGAQVTAPFPTFTWALAEGDTVDLISVSRSNAVDAEGLLLRGNSSILSEDATGTFYKVPKAVWAFSKGTYFWQVVGYSAGGDSANPQRQLVLPPTKFIVPTVLGFGGVMQTAGRNAASGDMQAQFTGYTTGNLDVACRITLVIRKGTRVVYRQVRSQSCAAGGYRGKIYMNWPNNTVARGTRVTGTLYLTGGGRTIASRVMAFRTP